MRRFSWCPSLLLLAALLIAGSCGRGGSGPYRLLDFQVEFGEHSIPAQMAAGETVTAEVVVKNISTNVWPSKPDERGHKVVNLSYHWLDRRGEIVVFDGLRTPLPRDVGPGESVRLNAAIQAPDRTGRHTLEVTLVQEAVAWFPERDGDKLSLPVRIAQGMPKDSHLSGKQLRTAQRAPEETQKSVQDDKPAGPVREARKAVELPVEKTEKRIAAKVEAATKERSRAAVLWTVQVAAFPERREAEAFAKSLRDKNYEAYVVVFQIKGKDWHRVRVGRLAVRAEADELEKVLKNKENFKQAFVTMLQ